ncbi:MAG: thioesterase family protein [Burkholderiales bacterium]|nr:acyl-CoA thioesterase [Betaproteobacteria bacterium]
MNHLWTEVVRVPFSDMDTLGHASHIAYFRYMQEARVAWVRSLAARLPRDHAPVVVAASCSYLAPVVYPANVEIEMTGGGAGRSSFVLHYALRAGTTGNVATGETRMVWFDLIGQRSAPLPDVLRALLPSRNG